MILKVFQKVLYGCKQALQKDALRAVVTGHPAPSASGRQAAFIAGPENAPRPPRRRRLVHRHKTLFIGFSSWNGSKNTGYIVPHDPKMKYTRGERQPVSRQAVVFFF